MASTNATVKTAGAGAGTAAAGLTAAQLLAKGKAKKAAETQTPEPPAVPLIARMVPLGAIKLGENPARIYQEDDDSIKRFGKLLKRVGIINPLTVTPAGKDGKYTLIAGFRRYAGAKSADMKEVPVYLWEGDVEGVNMHENLHREDPSVVEEALNIKRLAKENKLKLPYLDGEPGKKGVYGTADVAALLGKSESWVRQRCQLLIMPDKLLDQMHLSLISADAAFKLANLPEDCREEVMTAAKEFDDKRKAVAAKKAPASTTAGKGQGKQEPTAASKETVAARKREKAAAEKKAAAAGVTSAAVTKAANKKARELEASGQTDKAAQVRAAAGGGIGARTIRDFDEVMAALQGNGAKADEFAAMYADWKEGKIESEDLATWMLAVMTLAEQAG